MTSVIRLLKSLPYLLKTNERKVGEKTVDFYSWNFTQDEKDRLRAILMKFPAEKVTIFINDLEKLIIP